MRIGEGCPRVTPGAHGREQALHLDVALVKGHGGLNVIRKRTSAIIAAPFVVTAALVAEMAAFVLGIVANSYIDAIGELVWNAFCPDVDSTTTKGRGHIGRVGFLHGQ